MAQTPASENQAKADDPMVTDQRSGVVHADVLSIEDASEILEKAWPGMVKTETHLTVRRFHYDASTGGAPDGIVIIARGEAARLLSDFCPGIPSLNSGADPGQNNT